MNNKCWEHAAYTGYAVNAQDLLKRLTLKNKLINSRCILHRIHVVRIVIHSRKRPDELTSLTGV